MKSMQELMAELGFNKSAPVDTQKAFLKNLIQAANASQPRPEPQLVQSVAQPKPSPLIEQPVAKKARSKKMQIKEQLEFDLEKVDRVS